MTPALFIGLALIITGAATVALDLCVFGPQFRRMDAAQAAIIENSARIKASTAIPPREGSRQ